jgi:hypothetical protein
MAAAIDTRRSRFGKQQFGAILAVLAMGYVLGGASGVVLKTMVPVGTTSTAHAVAPAAAKFDTTLKAGERQASEQDLNGPSSDLTRALPAGASTSSAIGSVVARLGAMAPGFGGPMEGLDAGQSAQTAKYHEPGSRIGGNRI